MTVVHGLQLDASVGAVPGGLGQQLIFDLLKLGHEWDGEGGQQTQPRQAEISS